VDQPHHISFDFTYQWTLLTGTATLSGEGTTHLTLADYDASHGLSVHVKVTNTLTGASSSMTYILRENYLIYIKLMIKLGKRINKPTEKNNATITLK